MIFSAIAATSLFTAIHAQFTSTVFTGLTEKNITSESIEYDADNDVYYWANFLDGGIGIITGLGTNSPVVTEEYITDATDTQYSTGMVYQNGKLYVNNLVYGTFKIYNVTNQTLISSTAVNGGFSSGFNGLNGLCVDPANQDTLYATSIGLFSAVTQVTDNTKASIWSVDISDDTTPTFSRLYHYTDEPNGLDSIGFVPNGCIVVDGVVYFVPQSASDTPALVMYDIDAQTWSTDANVLTVPADGIVAIDNTLYATSIGGGLVSWEIGSNGVFEDVKEANWPLVSGADLCVGPDNSLVIPSSINEFCDIYYVTLPTGMPTKMPTKMPTAMPTSTMPSEGPTASATDIPTKSPTVDKGNAMRMSAYVSYVVGFVLFGCLWN